MLEDTRIGRSLGTGGLPRGLEHTLFTCVRLTLSPLLA